MLYSKLGSTGLIVSRLSLGTMSFGMGKGNAAIARTRQDEAEALVGRAIDAGINFFDCAEGYAKGESEKVMGRAIKHFNWNRNDIVVSTKVV